MAGRIARERGEGEEKIASAAGVPCGEAQKSAAASGGRSAVTTPPASKPQGSGPGDAGEGGGESEAFSSGKGRKARVGVRDGKNAAQLGGGGET